MSLNRNSLRTRHLSLPSRLDWNLEMLAFWGRGKPECLGNLSEQRREPTTNSTYLLCKHWELNLGNIDHCTTFALHSPVRQSSPFFQAPIIHQSVINPIVVCCFFEKVVLSLEKHLLVAVTCYFQHWNEKLVPEHCSVGTFSISWDILFWLLIQSMSDSKMNSLQGFVEKLKWINKSH